MVDLLERQAVALAGDADAREDNVDSVHQADERARLGELADEHVVDIVASDTRSRERAWLMQAPFITGQCAHPVPAPLERLNHEPPQVPGCAGDQDFFRVVHVEDRGPERTSAKLASCRSGGHWSGAKVACTDTPSKRATTRLASSVPSDGVPTLPRR